MVDLIEYLNQSGFTDLIRMFFDNRRTFVFGRIFPVNMVFY